jgi:hypothetical protein
VAPGRMVWPFEAPDASDHYAQDMHAIDGQLANLWREGPESVFRFMRAAVGYEGGEGEKSTALVGIESHGTPVWLP